MKIIDLSHPITEKMPFYPKTQPPSIEELSHIKPDGFAEKKIFLLTHTGTHVDAPCHIIPDTDSIDMLPLENFLGKGAVLNLSRINKATIDIGDLLPYQKIIENNDFILFNTGWYHYWNYARYFEDFPSLSIETSKWLSHFPLKGIGIDTVSIDSLSVNFYPAHKIILEQGIIIIENLNNLDLLPEIEFIFSCVPLPIKNGDGSPVRAFAIIDHTLEKGHLNENKF
ncbi:MAG: cyclase family protein [Peptococcaceae bacterium]|nr:cyclase family protein [Peptococcaceae bacterium]